MPGPVDTIALQRWRHLEADASDATSGSAARHAFVLQCSIAVTEEMLWKHFTSTVCFSSTLQIQSWFDLTDYGVKCRENILRPHKLRPVTVNR